MDYANIDKSQQAQVLRSRLQQYEAEHLNHATNLVVFESMKDDSDQGKAAIEQSKLAMATLDHAHAEVTKQLEALENEEPARPKKKRS